VQTIWRRKKGDSGWRYERVAEGRGKRTGDLKPPFYLRPRVNGKQTYQRLAAQTFTDAREEADKMGDVLEAAAEGLTVAEAENIANLKRTPIKTVVDDFMKRKSSLTPRSLVRYDNVFAQFLEIMTMLRVKFLDQMSVDVLRKYKAHLERKHYAGSTIVNRYIVVREMLAKNGVAARLERDELPIVEEEPAIAFAEAELKKLFAVMDDEESIRYRFFLGSGCREREVSFAAWADIDFEARKYTVRRKPEVGFTPKSHESRSVPLPASLAKALLARRKNAEGRWIFTNTEGNPEGHFLRKLKQIARRAGLNCGICATCKVSRECEHFILHRFRKTCATRWSEAGVPVRNIQSYLGHKSLETTQIYLGVTDTAENRKRIDTAFGD
jgi:integrase